MSVLQVQGSDGRWRDVELGDNEVAVVAGLALQHATGGLLRAAAHRVVGEPFGSLSGRDGSSSSSKPAQGHRTLLFELRPRPAAVLDLRGQLEAAGHTLPSRWATPCPACWLQRARLRAPCPLLSAACCGCSGGALPPTLHKSPDRPPAPPACPPACAPASPLLSFFQVQPPVGQIALGAIRQSDVPRRQAGHARPAAGRGGARRLVRTAGSPGRQSVSARAGWGTAWAAAAAPVRLCSRRSRCCCLRPQHRLSALWLPLRSPRCAPAGASGAAASRPSCPPATCR